METSSPLSQILHPQLPVIGMSAPPSAAHARVSSPQDFVLLPPPREQLRERVGMLFSEIPAYFASFVDFRTSNSSTSAGAATAASASFDPFSDSFVLDDWGPIPSSVTRDLDLSARSRTGSSDTASRAFAQQLHAPQDVLARIAFTPSTFGGLGMIAERQRPPEPPQEIDLTVSSSESESDDDGGSSDTDDRSATGVEETRPGHADQEGDDEDNDVEILQTRAPEGGGSDSPSNARYLTYSSVPPLRRKRRRTAPTNGADPVDLSMFDGQRAESTNVSLENNEVIERFKHALKCSICLDTIDEMTSTICGHVYCGKCIRLAIRVTAKCPLCQRHLRPIDVHPLYF